MANYYESLRSNTFQIKSSEKERIEKIFNHLMGEDVHTDIYEEDGQINAWFGCYGGLSGLDVEEYFKDDEELLKKYADDEYNAMADEIQKCLTDDCYFMLIDAGHEKLRYVGGGALVITSKHCEYMSIVDLAQAKGKELLSKDSLDLDK